MSASAQTQSDSTDTATHNKTKIDLVYENFTSTTTSSNGQMSSYSVLLPFIMVNNGTPVALDKKGNLLDPYYRNCPAAMQELNAYRKYRKTANLWFWSLTGASFATCLSGIISASNKEGDAATRSFVTRTAIGLGTLYGGILLARSKAAKADEHLRISEDLYDRQCYINRVSSSQDTTAPAPVAKDKIQAPPVKMAPQENVSYDLLRNEPENSGLFGIAIEPLVMDIQFVNISFNASASAFYTYKSKLRAEAGYGIAYWDNMTGYPGNYDENANGFTSGFGIPADYKKSNNFFIQTSTALFSKLKEGNYSNYLGRKSAGNLTADVIGVAKGNYYHTINLRAGYSVMSQVVQSENGINYKYKLPADTYQGIDGETYSYDPVNISLSPASINYGLISAGIGFVKYSDFKIYLKHERYKGIRETRIQRELYIDVLYTPNVKVEDILYNYDNERNLGPGSPLQTQIIDVSQSDVLNMGFRAGLNFISMGSKFSGLKVGAELGLRPGIKPAVVSENAYLNLRAGIVFGGRKS